MEEEGAGIASGLRSCSRSCREGVIWPSHLYEETPVSALLCPRFALHSKPGPAGTEQCFVNSGFARLTLSCDRSCNRFSDLAQIHL